MGLLKQVCFDILAAQTYCVTLWAGRKRKEPVMQALHVIWSAGATIGPFIVRPFLVPLPSSVNNATFTSSPFQSTSFLSDVNANVTLSPINSVTEILVQQVSTNLTTVFTDTNVYPDVSLVRYAFLVLASIGLIPATCFLFGFFCLTSRKCRAEKWRMEIQEKEIMLSEQGPQPPTQPTTAFYVLVLALLSLYYFSYRWVESIPGTLYGPFVVSGLGWDATSVSLVMSTFYGFHCLGRLVSVPVSMFLSPATMITINVVIIILAFSLTIVGAFFNDILVWISIAAVAFGMSSLVATGILLANRHITFTGIASSIVIIALSVGGVTGPPLAGLLMDIYGHMAFAYISLASGLSLAIVFAVLRITLHLHTTKKAI